MAESLSRRGLFRACLPARQEVASPDSPAMVARVTDACVEPRGVACRRCGEECDTAAIRFRPMGGGRTATLIDAALCTGCAACFAVCPVAAIELVAAERLALIAGLAELGKQS